MFKKLQCLVMALYLLAPVAAFGLSPQQEACRGAFGNSTCAPTTETGAQTLESGFARVANILIILIGAISVLMIIIGGLRYVLSGGDPGGTKSAKDTILYALIGVVVAILAYAIVRFVLTQFA